MERPRSHLKERLFGLTGPEGNHGEDVKEVYFYLDSTPTHSYMKALYKYPHAGHFRMMISSVKSARVAGYDDPEYELLDTGVFDEDRSIHVVTEYAKSGRKRPVDSGDGDQPGSRTAACHLLPQLWFRNTWSWGYPDGPLPTCPASRCCALVHSPEGVAVIEVEHPAAGHYCLYAEEDARLFTENETNHERLA